MKEILRRNLVNLLVAGVLYLNLAALLLVTSTRFPPRGGTVAGALPDHWVSQRIFRMFGVFSTAIDHCYGYSAMGVRERRAVAPADVELGMIDLDVYQYFPQSRGEAHQRLFLQTYYGDRERMARAYRRMADVIQKRHNERHPETPVEQVFLFQHWWPKSPEGYEERVDERQTLLLGHN